jgi:hypothetical protein
MKKPLVSRFAASFSIRRSWHPVRSIGSIK